MTTHNDEARREWAALSHAEQNRYMGNFEVFAWERGRRLEALDTAGDPAATVRADAILAEAPAAWRDRGGDAERFRSWIRACWSGICLEDRATYGNDLAVFTHAVIRELDPDARAALT